MHVYSGRSGMKSVCMLTSSHPAFDTRIFHKEARALARAGYRVTVVVPHPRSETVDDVFVMGIPVPGGRLARWLVTPFRVLRAALAVQADGYHFHDPELLWVGVALKAAGKRVVYDVHEDIVRLVQEKTYLSPVLRKALLVVLRYVESGCARVFDLVVVARDDIVPRFAWHPRVVAVNNYPMVEEFLRVLPSTPDAQEWPVVYVGALSVSRGAYEMVDAIAQCPPEMRLVIAGHFSPATLGSAVAVRPGFARVTVLGRISYAEVPQLMARSRAGIVCFHPTPNNVNAGPTKLFEYMAAGIPVVASDFPLWRDVVNGAKCGLCVDPTDPEALARALIELASDPERARQMGAAGRAAVRDRYSWSHEEAKLLDAYDQMWRVNQ